MGKIAIVVGATGLVGSHLVEQLEAADHVSKVLAVTRRSVEYQSTKIENVSIEFDRLEDYADLFRGDMLFSCLGTTIRQAGSIEAQRIVDYDYQYSVAMMSAEQGVDHYFLVSSSGANTRSMNAYLQMKGDLEQSVELLPFQSINIFQPSLLLGQRNDVRLGEQLASRFLPTLCKLPGLSRYRPIQGWQVAKKMLAVSEMELSGLMRFKLDEVFP